MRLMSLVHSTSIGWAVRRRRGIVDVSVVCNIAMLNYSFHSDCKKSPARDMISLHSEHKRSWRGKAGGHELVNKKRLASVIQQQSVLVELMTR